MNTPTDIQIIKQDGKPAFVVIPYHEYLKMLPEDEITVPHEVVELVIRRNMNLVKAWRTYLGLTQAEVAKRAGISQAALSQMERRENSLRTATLEKLAKAMGLHAEQLRD
ncbi:MAG: transcriptional regulator [Deltaproteobacteria bacterium]|nr:MAG: transcriptional regulator [Deltaproteobacteria bacterium]